MKDRTSVEHRQSPRLWLFWLAFLLCATLVKPVQDSFESLAHDPGEEPDLLIFTSPELVKKLALGYDNLVADFYWMRTIQYYGRRDKADKRPIRYKNLATLLDITTTLDPDLLDAYRVGGNFLAEPDPVGAGQPREALRLLDKGIRRHPREWRLWQDKGFIYYWFMKDYRSAGEVWLEGSRRPGAPHWMAPLAALSLSKGGAVEIAMALWRRQYEESDRADVKDNARNHLVSIEVMRNIWTLEALIERYRDKRGVFPASLAELVRGDETRYPIIDPLGEPYRYDPASGVVSLSDKTRVRFLPVPDSYRASITID